MPGEPRVRFESFKRSEYDALRELERQAPGTVDTAHIDAFVREAANSRLAFAAELLAHARLLVNDASAPGDHAPRLALNRAYYASHHALRAFFLMFRVHDPYGHQATIDYWTDFQREEPIAAAKLTGVVDLRRRMKDLMERRHVADYHPYNRASANEEPANFAVLAPEAIGLAEAVLAGVGAAFAARAEGKI